MKMIMTLFVVFVVALSAVPLNGPVEAQDSGVEVITRFAGRGAIHSLSWSPGGAVLAVSSARGVWLYDAALNDIAHFVPPGEIPATGVLAWSPDGALLAAGNGVNREWGVLIAETMTLWDMRTGDLVAELPITTGQQVRRLAWSPDGTVLAAYLWDLDQSTGNVTVWNLATLTQVFTQPVTGIRLVEHLAWSDDGGAVILTGMGEMEQMNQMVQITFDAADGMVLDQVTYPPPPFTSPDGTLHATIDRQEVIVTDAATGAVQHTFTLQTENRFARWEKVLWSANWQTLIAYSMGRTPQIVAWDVVSGAERWRVEMTRDNAVIDVALNPVVGALVVATLPGMLDVWDVPTGAHLATRWVDMRGIVSLDLSPDGTQLVTTNVSEFFVRVWDAQTGAGLHILPSGEQYVYSVAWSPDGSLIAGGTTQQELVEGPTSIFLWDAAVGAVLRTLEIEDGTAGDVIIPLRWSPDGTLLAAARQSNATARVALVVWDTTTWDEVYRGEFRGIAPFDWSPDGQWMVVAHSDHDIFFPLISLVHLPTGDTTTFEPPSAWIDDVAWRPSQDPVMWTIAAQNGDDQLTLLTLPVGESAPDVWLNVAPNDAWSQPGTLRWNPQGTVLAASGFNEAETAEVRLWTFETATTPTLSSTLGPFDRGRLIFPLAWSADGTLLAVGTGDGGATLYRIAGE